MTLAVGGMLKTNTTTIKEEIEGSALNSHGNDIADHGKSWQNHGIVFLNFCGNPYKIDNGPFSLKLCLPVSSADNLCKQFGLRTGSTHRPGLSLNCLA